MNEYYDHRTYEVTFNKPEYNATYNFIREKSGAFQYGNQTCVIILRGIRNIPILTQDTTH